MIEVNNEIISTGKTVEAALQSAAVQLGTDVSELKYEDIAEAKKGFLGIGEAPAKVRVFVQAQPADTALSFIKALFQNMDITAEIKQEKTPEGDEQIRIYGEEASVLIGHHGDTLEALQYLVNLAANKKPKEGERQGYTRVLLDIEDYRARREETLRALARRMAARVQKYGRSVTLEPMPAYERRIIHSEVQLIEEVSTYSIGQENDRRVVITKKK